MSGVEFQILTDSCDRVLRSDSKRKYRYAISWLHVIREHPFFLERYDRCLKGKLSLFYCLGRLAYNYARVLRHIALYSCRKTNELLDSKFDVIFVSHLLKPTLSEVEDDFYFGNIPDVIEKSGLSVLVLYQNFTRVNAIEIGEKNESTRLSKSILPHTLPLHLEILNVCGLIRESVLLVGAALRDPNRLDARVALNAALEAVSPESLAQLRLAFFVGRHAEVSAADILIFTLEGHPWEKLACQMFRGYGQEQKLCLGYQHAAVFSGQHAMFRALERECEADYVLTSGAVSNQICRDKFVSSATKVELIGSVRAPSQSMGGSETDKENICVVLPEGLPRECWLLFSATIEIARACPGVKFLWRLHPLMSFDSLFSSYPMLKDKPNNILLSSGNALEQDLDKSRWSLYRGSTAVVSSIQLQSRPVYYNHSDEPCIDPIATLSKWKLTANNIDALIEVFSSEDTRLCTEDFEVALSYARTFYTRLDPAKVVNVISDWRSETAVKKVG